MIVLIYSSLSVLNSVKAFPSSVRLKPLRKGPFMRQQRIPVTETDLDVKEVRSSKEDEGVQQRDDVGSSVPDMEVIEVSRSLKLFHDQYRKTVCTLLLEFQL